MQDDAAAAICSHMEFDLGSLTQSELTELNIPDSFAAILPLPSIGRTSMHVDICSDLIDACWVAERLADHAEIATAEEEYMSETHSTRIRLVLEGAAPTMKGALADAIRVFQGTDGGNDNEDEIYSSLRESIAEYEDHLEEHHSRFPEIIDHYYANLVNGAYLQYQSDAPEFYQDEISKFPERQLGFFKSAFSVKLSNNIYASPDSWLTPVTVPPDRFFSATGQSYRFEEFVSGEIFMLSGHSLVRSESDLLWFPMNQYFKSRVCESLTQNAEDEWPPDSFAWLDGSFTFSPLHDQIWQIIPETIRAPAPKTAECLVHRSGSLIIVSDGSHYHYLYDTKLLQEAESRHIFERISDLAQAVGNTITFSNHVKCDWSSLDDDQFEQLCYDLIFENPKFDRDTIRRMGKSRSRDGGRDIVVEETDRFMFREKRKWIFQCKLIRDGSSLTASKLRDVGDMIDQYNAKGFGVFTSAPIDATLYDKLDGVCQKRGIEQLHHSIHELERRLARHPNVLQRYFPAVGKE